MQWIEVSVPTRSDEIDDVCAQLAELGAGGMVVEDETDFQQFLEQNHQYWDYVDDALEAQFRGVSRIKFYLADDDDGRAQLAAIRAGIGRELTTATVRDSDWENNWRQYYQPIETGERLVVVPEWLDAPADGRLPLRLDPGLIFGTGSHATTRMCLAALEHCAGAGRTVLDLGCGSGILGIGALLLGCAHVTGCDIDPKAPEVAAANAALNGFYDDKFTVCAGDILADAGLRRRHHPAGRARPGVSHPGRHVRVLGHHRRARGRGGRRAHARGLHCHGARHARGVALLHGCAGVTGCSASPWTPEGPDLESLPLRLNFTAQQHHFYPNIEQTPDGFTHLGFVQ